MTTYSRFPDIEPFAVHHLSVSPLHTLYVEEVGNPKGIPVIYLHGGPGAGIDAKNRTFFDPDLFHGILFGQRGSTPSQPLGEVKENTTQLLVQDIETIRALFAIEKWIVFGGSWGSTLALAYALQHKEAVSALVLRGIFLGNQREMDWLYRDGASHLFPEEWQKFNEYIPQAEREDLVSAYERRLFDSDPQVQIPAAREWTAWEGSLLKLIPDAPAPMTDAETLSMARIECHYMFNHLFFAEDNYLLHSAHQLKDIPCHIVQGRYDVICPAESAIALAHELPQAQLHIVPDAGHSSGEPGITSELIGAMLTLAQEMKK
jgi:proline iminopeptidase